MEKYSDFDTENTKTNYFKYLKREIGLAVSGNSKGNTNN